MPFTIDFLEDHTLAWTATDDGATVEELTDWHPTFYVHAHASDASLRHVDDLLATDPGVVDLRLEDWRPGFRHDHEPMLAIDVDPSELLVKTNASKDVSQYEQHTRTVAALQRPTDAGLDPAPGQDVEFVVVNDDATTRDRVELAHELSGAYDPAFYCELLVRAAESVVSPAGCGRSESRSSSETRSTPGYQRSTECPS